MAKTLTAAAILTDGEHNPNIYVIKSNYSFFLFQVLNLSLLLLVKAAKMMAL
jgi:hypothetical protein